MSVTQSRSVRTGPTPAGASGRRAGRLTVRGRPVRFGGLGYALVSAAAFATSGAFAKSLLSSGWSPGAAVTVRIGGSALVLAVPALLALRSAGGLDRRRLALLISYGVVAIAGCQACYFAAIRYLTPGVALLLEYLAPVLLVGWTWVRHGRRPGSRRLAGMGVCAAGLLLVLDILGSAPPDPRGVGFALTAAVCLAGYFAMSSRTDSGMSPVVMTGGGLVVGAVTLAAVGRTGILPLSTSDRPALLAGATVPWWLPVTGLVLVSTVGAFLTGILATRRLGATSASFVGLTEVVFTVLWTAFLLTDVPTGSQVLGGLILLVGVTVVQADTGDSGQAAPGGEDHRAPGHRDLPP